MSQTIGWGLLLMVISQQRKTITDKSGSNHCVPSISRGDLGGSHLNRLLTNAPLQISVHIIHYACCANDRVCGLTDVLPTWRGYVRPVLLLGSLSVAVEIKIKTTWKGWTVDLDGGKHPCNQNIYKLIEWFNDKDPNWKLWCWGFHSIYVLVENVIDFENRYDDDIDNDTAWQLRWWWWR